MWELELEDNSQSNVILLFAPSFFFPAFDEDPDEHGIPKLNGLVHEATPWRVPFTDIAVICLEQIVCKWQELWHAVHEVFVM